MGKIKPLRRIGPLDAIEVAGEPGAPTIVVFHGFGADAKDLVSLSHLISVPPSTNWIFPNGPLKVSDGGIPGRAWFPLDTEALDEAMRTGTFRDFSDITPEGLKKARQQAGEMLEALSLPVSRVVFMGFSQGAMLATDIALRAQVAPLGLAILSGALLNKTLWKEWATKKPGLPFFQSHGDQDPLLSFEHAQALSELLLASGLKGQFHGFHGGHEIPQEVIFKLSAFLKKVLTTQN